MWRNTKGNAQSPDTKLFFPLWFQLYLELKWFFACCAFAILFYFQIPWPIFLLLIVLYVFFDWAFRTDLAFLLLMTSTFISSYLHFGLISRVNLIFLCSIIWYLAGGVLSYYWMKKNMSEMVDSYQSDEQGRASEEKKGPSVDIENEHKVYDPLDPPSPKSHNQAHRGWLCPVLSLLLTGSVITIVILGWQVSVITKSRDEANAANVQLQIQVENYRKKLVSSQSQVTSIMLQLNRLKEQLHDFDVIQKELNYYESFIVFITFSGSRYHRHTCQYLQNSPYIGSTLADAMLNNYLPCLICDPPLGLRR